MRVRPVSATPAADKAQAVVAELVAEADALAAACRWVLDELGSLTTDEYANGGDREARLRLAGALARWHDGWVCEACAEFVESGPCPVCGRPWS